MQLLTRLPLLSFSAAFDILFRYGGFAALVDAFGGGEEAMYQFWRIFFVSSPIGKINPVRVSQWVETMCTCFIVQSLEHPAHAVYLLRPVRHEIPESVSAWAVAGGKGNQLLRLETLVTAMFVFLPMDEARLPSLLQHEWFTLQEAYTKRSARGWLRFADEVICNHFFTRYWWMQQKEGPFYLLPREASGTTMGRVILWLAKRETLGLKRWITREEVAKMTRQLERAKETKEWKVSREEHTLMEKQKATLRKKNPKQKTEHAAAAQPKGKPRPHTTTSLSLANRAELERLTLIRFTKQMSILAQAKSALASMQVTTMENNFRRVLCLVVSLGHQHPRIKWSIKLALHEAAFETGRTTWDIERELYRLMYRRDTDPLAKLVRLSNERVS
jgi:hypothetical protein